MTEKSEYNNLLQPIPLIAYAVFVPLVFATFHFSQLPLSATFIDKVAVGLAVLGFSNIFLTSEKRTLYSPIPQLAILLLLTFIGYLFWLNKNILEQSWFTPISYEVRPLLYGALVYLWHKEFTLPTPKLFATIAAIFAIYPIINFLFASSIGFSHSTTFFGSQASTGVILLIGLCANLNENSLLGKIKRVLILLGILTNLSNEFLISAIFILLAFGPKGFLRKTFLILLSIPFILLEITADGGQIIGIDETVVIWQLISIVASFLRDPFLLITGNSIFTPLPFQIPPSIWTLLSKAQPDIKITGIFAYQVLPLWNHLMVVWGLITLPFAFYVSIKIKQRDHDKKAKALLLGCIIAGFYNSLFYSPDTAILLFCAFGSFFYNQKDFAFS